MKFKNFKAPCDFAKDFFPYILNFSKLRGYVSPEYIKDIGTPDRLKKAEIDFLNSIPRRSNLRFKQKAVFIDRDGTMNYLLKENVCSTKDLKVFDFTSKAIKLLNDNQYKVIVITNQPVIARGDSSFDELKNIHNKLETILGRKGVFLDDIFYCPHHPDKGYKGEVSSLKITCNCRKPEVGMYQKAIKKFNIDTENSWIIGDSTSDILAAKKINIKNILVNTGAKGLDYKYSVQPEFFSRNLLTAINFILNDYSKIKKKLAKVKKYILASKYKSYFVSGFSKSGKSTFSHVLKYELLKKKININVVSLDRWILPMSKRGDSLIDRFDIISIINFINKINNQKDDKKNYKLPNYDKLQNKQLNELEIIEIKKDDLVVFEGVVAGYIANLLGHNDKHFYIESNNNLRLESIYEDYIVGRGFSKKDVMKIIKDRNEELQTIHKYKNLSKLVVKLR